MRPTPLARKTPLRATTRATTPLKVSKLGQVSKAPQKLVQTKIGLRREWLIPDTSGPMRYTGLRGIYWYWLSRDIRKKEWEKWNGMCITCLVPLQTWEEGQCGHILASSFCGEYLRFNRLNLTIQHAKCNNPRFSPHAGIANAVNIDKRYGTGYMEQLYMLRKKEAKNPTDTKYKELIRGLDSYKEAQSKALALSPSQD